MMISQNVEKVKRKVQRRIEKGSSHIVIKRQASIICDGGPFLRMVESSRISHGESCIESR